MNGKDGHTMKFEKESPKNTGAKKHSTELTETSIIFSHEGKTKSNLP